MKNDQGNRIWLSPPFQSGEELALVKDALESNWLAPLGPHLKEFEASIAKLVESEQALALSSGTAALHLALVVLGVQKGDYVIVPSFTFVAPLNCIKYLGAEPIIVDADADTWNMNPDLLKEALESLRKANKLHKLKAILPVHIYGMPASMNEICSMASEYSIPVLEDAAEALGSRYFNQAVGSIGDIGVSSFNGNKIITTSAGGALFAKNRKLVERAEYLSTQARESVDFYLHEEVGYNYRMSNILAALGLAQLKNLEDRIDTRRRTFETYQEYFKSKESLGFEIEFQKEADGLFSNRWLTCISINPKNNNGLSINSLKRSLAIQNIESRNLFKPMHQQSPYKDCRFFHNGVSDRLFDQGLCLPSGSALGEKEFDRIFSSLEPFFESA